MKTQIETRKMGSSGSAPHIGGTRNRSRRSGFFQSKQAARQVAEERLNVEIPVTIQFVKTDGSVEIHLREAIVRSVDETNWILDATWNIDSEAQAVAIGVKSDTSNTSYLGATLRSIGRLEVGDRYLASFDGFAHDMLGTETLLPYLDGSTFRYRKAFPQSVYDSWLAAGILRTVSLDEVLVCPSCEAIPTFRYACQQCGSGRLKRSLLIHHFACAYVGRADEFEKDGALVCPKCRVSNLVAGTDFEYSPAEYRCQSCHWADSELQQTAHCLGCDRRFPASQAESLELIGYDAQRLDLLAFREKLV